MPRFVYSCPRRWSDQDTYGHINNVQILRYLEEVRVGLFFDSAPAAGVDGFEGSLVVVRHEIDYRRPLPYRPAPVVIECAVRQIRNASFTLEYVVRDSGPDDDESNGRGSSDGGDGPAGRVCAEAVTVLAATDPATGRSRRLTEAERTWLEHYHDGGPDAAESAASRAVR